MSKIYSQLVVIFSGPWFNHFRLIKSRNGSPVHFLVFILDHPFFWNIWMFLWMSKKKHWNHNQTLIYTTKKMECDLALFNFAYFLHYPQLWIIWNSTFEQLILAITWTPIGFKHQNFGKTFQILKQIFT